MVNKKSEDINGGEQSSPRITRRAALTALGSVFTYALFKGIGVVDGLSNMIAKAAEDAGHDLDTPLTPEEEAHLDEDLQHIANEVEAHDAHLSAENPEMDQLEKARLVVDHIGSILFGLGIRDLMPGGHGHIHKWHYTALIALTTIKYQLADQHGKDHLVKETKDTAKAAAVIAGTVVLSEGLTGDVAKAYESMEGQELSEEDSIAIINMLASVVSPAVTTVGSAGLVKDMTNKIAGDNANIMAVFESHVSNLSGFLLFGDPPFIAMVNKYGFEEAVAWQLKTMWPLAIYSLLSATAKVYYLKSIEKGMSPAEAIAFATKETPVRIASNLPVLTKFIAKSLANAMKYYSFGSAVSPSKFPQTEEGIQFYVGEVLADKINQAFVNLPFAEVIHDTHHESHEGLTSVTPTAASKRDALIGVTTRINNVTLTPEQLAQYVAAIDSNDSVELKRLSQEFGLNSGVNELLDTLNDLADDDILNNSQATPETLRRKLNPMTIFDRITNVDRMKASLGHNLGDIIDVFPFQAGCVPFLATEFKLITEYLNQFDELTRDYAMFLLIMGFSSLADNYVACVLGLEVMPDKPNIPLIASIIGGQLSAVGNMANVAQFSLDKYPLVTSFKKIYMHADTVAAGMAYSMCLDKLRKVGIFLPPNPLAPQTAH